MRMVIDQGSVVVDGIKHMFDVVDARMEGNPPLWFVSNYGERPWISSEVPPLFRPPMIYHEIVEMGKHSDLSQRCLQATKEEIDFIYIQKIDRELYVPFRIATFVSLVEYMRNHPRNYTHTDINRTLESLTHLRSLL